MADTSLYTLLPQVAIRVPGCPENVQKEALRETARGFCRDTEIWRLEITLDSVEDQTDYDLNAELTHDAEVLRLLTVTLNDAPVLDADRTFDTSGTLSFDTAPTESDLDIVVNAAILPYQSCDSYPDWLIRQWGDAIQAGAIANLKAYTNRPWSDPQGAALKESEYRYKIGQAKLTLITGRQSGNVRVQYQPFGIV